MDATLQDRLDVAYAAFSRIINTLVSSRPIPIGDARLPATCGVYLFLVDGAVVYAGEAKGSGGLADRILSKHVFGDDNHAIQRAFKVQFPDRAKRRDYIRTAVSVQWVEVPDRSQVAIVERLLIWLLDPPWNRT